MFLKTKNKTFVEEAEFIDNKDLICATLSDEITCIKADAFRNCKNLKQITLSDKVLSIGAFAFSNCKALEEIVIPAGCMIERGAFEYSGLKKVTFKGKIGKDTIPPGAFRGTKLTVVALPKELKTIDIGAFESCSSLEVVLFNSTLKKICANAFAGCVKFDNIKMPKSIEYIGRDAFTHTALWKRKYEKTEEIILNGHLLRHFYTENKHSLNYIDASVNNIASGAFSLPSLPKETFIMSGPNISCVRSHGVMKQNFEGIAIKNVDKPLKLETAAIYRTKVKAMKLQSSDKIVLNSGAFTDSAIEELRLTAPEIIIHDNVFSSTKIKCLAIQGKLIAPSYVMWGKAEVEYIAVSNNGEKEVYVVPDVEFLNNFVEIKTE